MGEAKFLLRVVFEIVKGGKENEETRRENILHLLCVYVWNFHII